MLNHSSMTGDVRVFMFVCQMSNSLYNQVVFSYVSGSDPKQTPSHLCAHLCFSSTGFCWSTGRRAGLVSGWPGNSLVPLPPFVQRPWPSTSKAWRGRWSPTLCCNPRRRRRSWRTKTSPAWGRSPGSESHEEIHRGEWKAKHDSDQTAAFSCFTDKRTMKCAIGNWKKGTCSLVRSSFIDCSRSNSGFLMKAWVIYSIDRKILNCMS